MKPASTAGEWRVLGAEAADSAAPRNGEELRRTRRELGRALDDLVDRFVGQVDDILGGPVVPVSRRVVERALEVGVRGRREEVGVRRQRADRGQRPFAVGRIFPPTCR